IGRRGGNGSRVAVILALTRAPVLEAPAARRRERPGVAVTEIARSGTTFERSVEPDSARARVERVRRRPHRVAPEPRTLPLHVAKVLGRTRRRVAMPPVSAIKRARPRPARPERARL